MKKRQFLASGVASLAFLDQAQAKPQSTTLKGPPLLTITGAIKRSNRGALDTGRDILMSKHKLQFDKGYCFDFAGLQTLPKHSIKPTLEYDGKVHQLQGPLLLDVLKVAGIGDDEKTKLVLRAVDGYAATVSVAQARKFGIIIADSMDQAPMALGGLGPLWAVFDGEKQPEYAGKSLSERFAACPWALYHIEVVLA